MTDRGLEPARQTSWRRAHGARLVQLAHRYRLCLDAGGVSGAGPVRIMGGIAVFVAAAADSEPIGWNFNPGFAFRQQN